MTIRAKQQRKQRATIDRAARRSSSVWYRVRRFGLPGAMLIRDAVRWTLKNLPELEEMIVAAPTVSRAPAEPYALEITDPNGEVAGMWR